MTSIDALKDTKEVVLKGTGSSVRIHVPAVNGASVLVIGRNRATTVSLNSNTSIKFVA